MQLTINNPDVGGEARIFYYAPQMNYAYGIVHTYTKGTYEYTERILRPGIFPTNEVVPTRTAIYTIGPNPINQLAPSEYVARVYFPFNINNNSSYPRPSLTTDILTDEDIIQPLPSFDGGDGSPGEYKRTTLNVIPGDILEIKVGGSVNSTIVPRTSLNNSKFTYGVSNVLPGKETSIEVSNRASTRITALGGLGGLPNPKSYAGKPGLPANSFVYPTPTSGLLPPGWQKGYGAGGRTIRDTNQYDNPILRSSHGCVMIKFS
jgi:hypothetical protein